ncbi:MAG: hypothetical protein AAFR74_00035 [Pseudomonadota bacterium]
MIRTSLVALALAPALLAACTNPGGKRFEFREVENIDPSAGNVWFEALSTLCGRGAYAGELVSTDEVDADFRNAAITVGPAICNEDEIGLPLAVGEDRSRTWVVTRLENGLRLKHDHRHKDGTPDALTWYGGMAFGDGRVDWQQFPVDQETRALFIREGIEVSNQNTWALEIEPFESLAYQMWRPNRNFRIEFDLTQEVAAPPPPWGLEPVE